MARNVQWLVVIALFVVVVSVGANTACAGDKEDIVGRWDNPVTDKSYIRFNEDGTFKWVCLLETSEGKYRFIGKEVIELDTPGVLYGRNQTEIKYRLNGDTLELKIFNEYVKFKRVK
jgi:hypothetical protein